MVLYSGAVAYIFFSILRHMNRFRIGDTIEIAGMDMLDYAIKPDHRIEGTEILKGQVLQLEEKQKKANDFAIIQKEYSFFLKREKGDVQEVSGVGGCSSRHPLRW